MDLAAKVASDFKKSPLMENLREEHSHQRAKRAKARDIKSALAMCRRHMFIWSTREDDIDAHTMKQIRSTLEVVNNALDWVG